MNSAASQYFGSGAGYQVERINPALGDDATAQRTIELMAAHSARDAQAPAVLAALRESGATQGNRLERASRIWQWIRRHVRFESDQKILARLLGLPEGQDLLISPAALLEMPRPAGDCDDQSMLFRAMASAAGIPVEFVASKSEPLQPDMWSHVYTQIVLENGQRYVLDCSHGLYPGYEVPRRYARRVWTLETFPPRPVAAPTPIDMNYLQQGLGDYNDGDTIVSDTDPEIYTGGSSGGGWQTVADVAQRGIDAWYKLASLPRQGEYVQTAGGTRAYGVPGAVPSPYVAAGGVPVSGGINVNTLLIAGVAIAVVAMISSAASGKKH